MNRLWTRQILAMLRLEIKKCLFSPRALPLHLLAALPVLIVGLVVVVRILFEPEAQGGGLDLSNSGATSVVFAHVYQFVLRFVLYAGCVWIFMNLFRGEILDRSLHYYFLTPIRREVLVAGKFLAGWVSATALFVASGLSAQIVLHGASGWSGVADLLFGAAGAGRVLAYAGITALACLGYGAVFLAIGLFVRNPIVPAIVIWIWESANAFLPALLKKISVIFYLQSLLPVAIDIGPLGIVTSPTPAYLAVPGLLVFTTIVLLLAGRRIRALEIAYGSD